MIELLWLLLPVAAASGWWVARREPVRHVGTRADRSEYFRGLNYLLDDKPDQAIEVFGRMADIDRDIVETQMVLGNLFRRRGEVDRAIHIHHNLVSGKRLTARQRSRAILELGEDYMRAGLFDRAESLFRELSEQPEHAAIALVRLVDIYEQEKDWSQAIVHCDHLARMTGQEQRVEVAHFFCERAEQALEQGNDSDVQTFLRCALERDENCVRASILQGNIALAARQFEPAVAMFQAVEKQDIAYFSEVIRLLDDCYAALNRRREFLDYLGLVQRNSHSGRITAAYVELLAQQESTEAALEFLEVELQNYPTFWGLRCFVELKLKLHNDEMRSGLEAFYKTSMHMLDGATHYRCDNCGFNAKSLHWHCPSCKKWSTIKPLADLLCRNST